MEPTKERPPIGSMRELVRANAIRQIIGRTARISLPSNTGLARIRICTTWMAPEQGKSLLS